MLQLLDRIREKPRHKRQQFAFFVALSVTLIVALVWVISLSATVGSFSIPSTASVGDAAAEKELFNGARTGLQQIVETAETFGGLDLQGADEENQVDISDLLQNNGNDGTLSGEEAGPEKRPKTEPKRVLIATTSSEKSE